MFARLSYHLTLCAVFVGISFPASAASNSDIVRIFGRDPGASAAHACFVRHYNKAHLASHAQQNVTDMLVYVNKQDGTDPYYNLNMQVNFRQIAKPFQVSGGCSAGADGKHALGCGVDCDGGHLDVRVKNETSVLVEIPESVRLYDPADTGEDETGELPKDARFGADDKLFRLDRTDLKDCLPVVYDEEIKAKISKGVVTR
jgi:hypothetical protein